MCVAAKTVCKVYSLYLQPTTLLFATALFREEKEKSEAINEHTLRKHTSK